MGSTTDDSFKAKGFTNTFFISVSKVNEIDLAIREFCQGLFVGQHKHVLSDMWPENVRDFPELWPVPAVLYRKFSR